MVGKYSITKVAVVGNTKLTLKALLSLNRLPNIEIKAILGLGAEKCYDKVNYTPLSGFVNSTDTEAVLIQEDNWDLFYECCNDLGVELIILLGDSRIVPNNILKSFKVIGNHGAVLPDFQGGASLVWGRMINNGEWGISIMEIEKKVDSGKILKIKKFNYEEDCSEEDFTNVCDDLTVQALLEVIRGEYQPIENISWDVKIAKHTDSSEVIDLCKICLSKGLNIYLPPRTPKDSLVKDNWDEEFKYIFKISNDKPYPKWYSPV
tara:strand:+ start:696 stop:1484 length:789 start_codon:yes stop_codon:yes gene_type:complete